MPPSAGPVMNAIACTVEAIVTARGPDGVKNVTAYVRSLSGLAPFLRPYRGGEVVPERNTLIALRPQKGTYHVSATSKPNHGELFKVTKNSSRGCKLVLQNNVFLVTNYAGHIDPSDDPLVRYDMLDTAACRGRKNTIVYVGKDPYYLARLRAADPACFNVTTDINVWRAARAAWFDRHPQFEAFRNAEPVGAN